ncbi:gibberellin 20 oxidase 2-like isoform X2 [Gastrolobium bilobum]|uniref:gibberellin 20 oxidase 2-like isoform X2 n=1 Tax=Gastrolobium bilobum TaxID=150636 RepID=UPI002AB11DDC|nr:gibberellin 20 oxidase 2-like isoform X2 [Gastrolobium bilobum]
MAIECVTSTKSMLQPSPPKHNEDNKEGEPPLVFDGSLLRHKLHLPKQFIWPDKEKPCLNVPELVVPLIDLGGFLSGDPVAAMEAARLVGEACQKHGFFLVVNHGIDANLISDAHSCMDDFFEIPLSQKQRAQRKQGEHCGYASSFTGRFSSKLPWKETLSFQFSAEKNSSSVVKDYLCNTMGKEFEQFGKVYQDYCEAMSTLSLGIMELLGMSLGVGKECFREFFEENSSIMRLNYYPPCQKPDLTLGTGPHCDPTSLTILHQDQVGGLQVFVDNEWRSIKPNFNAFVVNIGDTFMVVTPPSGLVDDLTPRIYPDFTWPMLLEFTQKHYRADMKTLEAFTNWLQQKRS